MTAYRLWPSTSGPSAPVNYSGNFISGVVFCVTAEAWFQGYWWWVCPNSGGSDGFQNTTATKCALWQRDSGGTPHLVSGSVVTSGTLTAGQWNYIPLSTPILLSLGGSTGMTPAINGGADGAGSSATYIAAIGCNGPFPDTNNYWGSGQTAPNGITNGPLTAFSAQSGGMPAPYSTVQGTFSTAGTDPSVNCPLSASNTDNFWVDIQVSDYSGAPPGTSLRLWPSFPVPALGANNDTGAAVTATAFTLSQACTLDRIWMYSPASNTTGLATRVGIWNTDTQTEVSGTDNSSPSWSGSAGSGWIYVDYTSSGVTLPAGNYAVAFFNGGGLKIYFDSSNYFFAGTDPVGGATVGGAGWNGISAGGGILTAPNVAAGPELTYDDGSGTKRGQTLYSGPTSHVATTTWVYPVGFEASADWGETRWADVEVTPSVVSVDLTTPNLALAAPLVSVKAGATVALTAPNVALAAPVPAVSAGGTVALTAPNLALAAPLVSPSAGGSPQSVSLTTPNLALAAPLVSPSAGAAVALTAPGIALAAPVLAVTAGGRVILTAPGITLAAPSLSLGSPQQGTVTISLQLAGSVTIVNDL